jgi:hypothetical protein
MISKKLIAITVFAGLAYTGFAVSSDAGDTSVRDKIESLRVKRAEQVAGLEARIADQVRELEVARKHAEEALAKAAEMEAKFAEMQSNRATDSADARTATAAFAPVVSGDDVAVAARPDFAAMFRGQALATKENGDDVAVAAVVVRAGDATTAVAAPAGASLDVASDDAVVVRPDFAAMFRGTTTKK